MKFNATFNWILLAACLIISGCDKSSGSKSTGKIPKGTNVLLVTLDTTRADRLGFYGYGPASTPTLDALAARSAVFDDAHATVPLTLPSHATILTGRHPREHGLRVNGRDSLGDAHPTLATIFKESGYRTGAFVSTFVLDKRYGLDRGFAVYDDDVGHDEAGDDGHGAERTADAVTATALSWLKADSNQPFFCWVHYYDPHDPYAPPPEFRQRHANPYDGEIAFMDSELSKIVDWLKSTGHIDRTLIVVAGDHGESFGEHGELGHTTFLYETNVRVPLMFAHPDAVTAGRRVTKPVSLVDIFPTILELFGLPLPDGLMGQSLAAALTGGQPDARPCYAESEHVFAIHSWAQQRAILTEDWKFVSSTKPELFDRRSDRGETRNLAGEKPELVKEMQQTMETLYAQMTPTLPRGVAQSQEAMKRLESLGYVSGGGGSRPDEVLTQGLPDPKDLVDVIRELQHAHNLVESKRFDEALPILEKSIKRSPQSVEILQRLGRAYLRADRTAEAIEILRKAVQLDPTNPKSLRAIGDAYVQVRRFPEAIEHYELLLEQLPDSPDTLDQLGSALLEAGKVDEAIARFQLALKLRPDYGDAMAHLGAALTAKGALDDAQVILQKAAANPETAAQANFLLSRLAARRNQKDLVFKHLEKAVELNPGYVQAVEALVGFYLPSGRTSDAIRVLRAALQESPGNVPISLTLAEILAMSKDDSLRNGEEAVRIAEPLVATTPGTRALTAFAAAKAETGDFEAAVQSAEQALVRARAAGNEKLIPFIEAHLESYRAKQPVRNKVF